MSRRGWRWALPLVALGAGAGFLSGLFGVGGGIIIVPMLVLFGFDIKRASAISLGAVLIISITGVISYAALDQVNWLLALYLAIGSVVGAQLGSRLLGKFSSRTIQYFFAAFLLLVAISLFVVPAARDTTVELTVWSALAAIAVGLIVGTLASILGIGGGVMIVPILMLGFGAGDLVARGTAIGMMIPTSISGTIAHLRAGRADLPSSLLVGVGAVLTTTLGALTAKSLDPKVGNVLFGVLLVVSAVQLAQRARKLRAA